MACGPFQISEPFLRHLFLLTGNLQHSACYNYTAQSAKRKINNNAKIARLIATSLCPQDVGESTGDRPNPILVKLKGGVRYCTV